METIYQDIAARTGGNIYIGVVGPVRTGKSTLIKRIMEEFVIPAIDDPYRRERARDELPQSGSGKTIMTSEPKFVPEEAVEICPDGAAKLRVRLIDSVGYLVDGALGAWEDDGPRMVTTPWFDHEIPMTEAAEVGTRKVMQEHCSIGIVMTTDGSVTDISRQDYLDGEKRAIRDMQATGKPYLVIVNSRDPEGESAKTVKAYLKENFGVDAVAADCQNLNSQDICKLLCALLYAFPVGQVRIHMPRWLEALEQDHPVRSGLYQALLEIAGSLRTLGQVEPALSELAGLEQVSSSTLRRMDLGTGTVDWEIRFPEKLYYDILSARAGVEITGDTQLLALLTELTQIKKEYDRIADALSAVNATGYGVVMPTLEQLQLQKPEIVKKGGSFGVRLKAAAPSIHMVRVDIDTQISPMVGDEQRSRELVDSLTAGGWENLGQNNIFGRSVYDLLQDGLSAKLVRMPQDVREKFRGTLSRIVNEGATGLVCLIL